MSKSKHVSLNNLAITHILDEDGERLKLQVHDRKWIRFFEITLAEGDREKLIDLLQKEN